MKKTIKNFILLCTLLFSSVTICAQSNWTAYSRTNATRDLNNTYIELMPTSSNSNYSADLYNNMWDNTWCHPYKNLEVPKNYEINLTNFHMPIKHNVVTSNFGYRPRFRRNHYGVDIKGYIGDTIYATWDGKARVVKNDPSGYGLVVILRHNNGLETIYGHMSKQLVKVNQTVKAGEPIGLCGNTGRSFGSHLHFETRLCGLAIDPRKIFDFEHMDIQSDNYIHK